MKSKQTAEQETTRLLDETNQIISELRSSIRIFRSDKELANKYGRLLTRAIKTKKWLLILSKKKPFLK